MLNRYRINTPAVTRVDECTSADTGVGAAMAAGSQLEYGTWALFVIAASMIPSHLYVTILSFIRWSVGSQSPLFMVITIDMRRNMSPNRLVIIVNIPALNDRELL